MIIRLTLFLSLWLFGCSGNSPCNNVTILTQHIDGTNLKIVVFQRDCGATTGFSTQASIIEDSKDLPDETGNVFVADTDHGKAPSGKGGGPELRVRIIGKGMIELSYDFRARVFVNQQEYSGVKISYSTYGAS